MSSILKLFNAVPLPYCANMTPKTFEVLKSAVGNSIARIVPNESSLILTMPTTATKLKIHEATKRSGVAEWIAERSEGVSVLRCCVAR